MKHNLTQLFLICLIAVCPIVAMAMPGDIDFYHLRTSQGLSNGQVNYIYRDSRGFVWMATQSGLNRYDGFRFRVFYFEAGNKKSLPSNFVDHIQEGINGHLWVHTAMGYCIYDPLTETFDTDMQAYFSRYGIRGDITRVGIDPEKNLWVAVAGQGIHYVDTKTGVSRLLPFTKAMAQSLVTAFAFKDGRVVVNFNNGFMMAINRQTMRMVWSSDYVSHRRGNTYEASATFIDRKGNYWVTTRGEPCVYNSKNNRWYASVNDFLTQNGISLPFSDMMMVKDVAEDSNGGIWLATDHLGLIYVDFAARRMAQYTYNRNIPTSISNNTIQSLMIDRSGALWIGCYKNGISYYSPSQSKFQTLPVGDVCTIAEDADGLLWCGTNDKGIVAFNRATGSSRTYGKAETHLGSDVVVSSLAARDGSLWFGTFNGGLVHYVQGRWQVYRADGRSGLLSDNVWSLCQLPDGRIAIGTLGGGLQILDPETGRFTNFTAERNKLGSNYVSSIALRRDGTLLVGHSVNFSIVNPKTGYVKNFTGNRAGQPLLSTEINQVFEDSRGIIWVATASGMNAYDPKTDQLARLDWQVGMTGSVACSVIEDRHHNIWMVSDHGVARVVVKRDKGQWTFFTTSYNNLDGLQDRQFNYRSILLARDGTVIIGGQDGLNIIPTRQASHSRSTERVIFSGLVLFDHPLHVGEEYDGHVVLKSSLEESRKLRLNYDENAFTLQLASSAVALPEKSRFMYRLKGFSDKWLFTTEGQSSVTYTNMSPGRYTLEARVVTRYGVISDEVSRLEIVISPPFYLSIWALLLYAVIIVLAVWYVRRVIVRRQQTRLKMQRIKMEADRIREVNDIKLSFFTNVSHELRTPLTLIISPLSSLMRRETDPDKHRSLELIYRNALRLLDMVTQILDFRKMDKGKETLNLSAGDIVAYVGGIVDTVKSLNSKGLTISFHSPQPSYLMAFDADKVRKMVDNILSNAIKFTPEGGRIDVQLVLRQAEDEQGGDPAWVDIRVADTGVGISDEDKAHIFDRFYQAHNHKDISYTGTGVGLNLVHGLAQLHGGKVTVADNPGGGSVFTITLPIRHEAAHELPVDAMPSQQEASPTDGTMREQGSGEPTASTSTDTPLHEVLIVDDSHDFLEFMTEELGRRFRVRTALNGKEALNRINEHKPDIILSDVMMPEMDGNELCRHLKANKDTPRYPS